VIAVDGALSFDALLQRIHPAASRVRTLARETPATFLMFDLLVDARGALLDLPLDERRAEDRAAAHGGLRGSSGGVWTRRPPRACSRK
jgi:hypothetical protein